jgi:DNA-binding CsgD family transcriptional regulator
MADREINWTFGDPLAGRGGLDGPAPAPTAESRAAAHSFGILTIGLSLSVFVAASNLLQAVPEGLGTHPLRRVAIGVVLLALSIALLARRGWVMRWLHDAPWMILLLAAFQFGLVGLEGLPESPYFTSCLTTVGIAVVSSRAGLAWACALLIDLGYAVVAFAVSSPAQLAQTGRLGTVLGELAEPVTAAVVLLGLMRMYRAWTERIVMRALHAPVADEHPDSGPLLLGPAPQEPAPWVPLTPSEVRVVRELALYGTSREITEANPRAKSTVDNALNSAMHKTGVRTRAQLVALTAHPWFSEDADDRSYV